MKFSGRKTLGWTAAAIALVFVVSVALWLLNRPKPVTSVDALMVGLASEVQSTWDLPKDFKLTPTGIIFPVGALLRPEGRMVVDDEACLPSRPASKFAAVALPHHKMTTGVAADIGLGGLLSNLTSASIVAKTKDRVEMSIDGPSVVLLTDARVEELLRGESCNAAVNGRTMWLVRGHVLGRRRILLENVTRNEVSAALAPGARISTEAGSGKASVGVEDKQEVAILYIVSQVSAPASGGGKPSDEIKLEPPALAPAPDKPGLVYVQRDRADSPAAGVKVVSSLRQQGLTVASAVEAVESRKMPATAQVRYFNESDRDAANRALSILKDTYPDASIVRITLPAPAGQLEVWLPRHPGR